jgi:isopentenyl diphosphate isomerase/L-lactate dehydrogenase-like FMN-dependent dehydrogenase
MGNEFVRLVADQLASDLRELPRKIARGRPSARIERCASIEDLRLLARRAVPRAVFDYVDGAAGDEVTYRRNQGDLAELVLVPRILRDVSRIDLATSVLGQPVDIPLLGAPTGLTGLTNERGEVGVGRAVHAAGSIYVLSAMGSYSIDEFAEQAPGPTWFQLYVWRDRGLVQELLDRARATGCRALVLTTDTPMLGSRERDRRNGFGIPPRLTGRSIVQGLLRPRWSTSFVRRPRITLANAAKYNPDLGGARTLTGYMREQFDATLSWSHVEWIRERWDGPLVIKGLMHPDDATAAVSAGASAVVISNHGGRQLDHAPSTISALPAVLDAVGDDAEVYIDGGFRRGVDVLKALALGARAVLVGRALVYGLGAGGDRGAARAMEILVEEMRLAMALAGAQTVSDLDPSWLRPAAVGGTALSARP